MGVIIIVYTGIYIFLLTVNFFTAMDLD